MSDKTMIYLKIGGYVVGVGAVIAGGYYLYKYLQKKWPDIKGWFGGIWNKIKDPFGVGGDLTLKDGSILTQGGPGGVGQTILQSMPVYQSAELLLSASDGSSSIPITSPKTGATAVADALAGFLTGSPSNRKRDYEQDQKKEKNPKQSGNIITDTIAGLTKTSKEGKKRRGSIDVGKTIAGLLK